MDMKAFDTDKRIRLGIWGLGRGMSFFDTCRHLNIDVVAGCDYNEHMRANFLKHCPGAAATADEEEFLAGDFDAVLLATYMPSHGADTIKCLRAGKHVLAEVTSFFSMAEGVRLVEEVERAGLVYNLSENYPFTAENMWLASRWRAGLFGDLAYAEYEYVHECRSLAYTYIDGVPVVPGHAVHNWRSWFNFHYYCTHSLGPVMAITGRRPVAVEAFRATPAIAGYLQSHGACGGRMTPSLIQMDNGSVVRNLMGAGTSDSHVRRIWGTRGAFEMAGEGLKLRLGASGGSPKLDVIPKWEGLGELAAKTGHGGGDFWTLYYFAREILTGEKGPFDIYGACDVTLPGIQAVRSEMEGGRPMEVPDFRDKKQRAKYRDDDWTQERYPTKAGVFGGFVPEAGDTAAEFSRIMKDLVRCAPLYRAYVDWCQVREALKNPADLLPVAKRLLDNLDRLVKTCAEAREILAAHPGTDGATVLAEMLEVGGGDEPLSPAFRERLEKDVAELERTFPTEQGA